MSKNAKLLDFFVAYCKLHPELRFWQALRSWSGYAFIYVGSAPLFAKLRDTFSFEEDFRKWPRP